MLGGLGLGLRGAGASDGNNVGGGGGGGGSVGTVGAVGVGAGGVGVFGASEVESKVMVLKGMLRRWAGEKENMRESLQRHYKFLTDFGEKVGAQGKRRGKEGEKLGGVSVYKCTF